MIQSSQALKNYINTTSRDNRQYIRAEIEIDPSTIISVSLDEMVNGSFSFNKQSVSGSYFDIGQAYIDNAHFSIDREYLEDNYSGDLARKLVRVYYGVKELTPGVDEEIRLYTGIVPLQGVTRTLFTVNIEIDSMLSLLDIPLDSLISGTPSELFNYMCNMVGIQMSDKLTSALNTKQNAQYTYYTTNATNIKTYLDLAMWLGQILGGSLTCNNRGELDLVTYDTSSTAYALDADIVKKSTTNDAEQLLDAVTLTIGSDEIYYVGSADNEAVLRLDQNMLISELEDSLIDTVIDNIFQDVHSLPIRGFKYDYNGNPLIELGDKISYNNTSTFVQNIVYKFRGASSLSGYGIDPRVSNSATTQAVKSASTTGGKAQVNQVAALQFNNAGSKEILYDEYSRIADINLYLYENTSLLINVTMTIKLSNESADYLDRISIKQIYDEVELPTRIAESICHQGYKQITFNCITPSTDVYDRHTYSLDAALLQNTAAHSAGDTAGTIDINQLEADLLVVVGIEGKPAVPPVLSFEDNVKLAYAKPKAIGMTANTDSVNVSRS